MMPREVKQSLECAVNREQKTSTASIRAVLQGNTDDLYRALSLLRRKAFHIRHLVWDHPGTQQLATLELVLVKATPDNPYCPKQLLQKLVGFKEIESER